MQMLNKWINSNATPGIPKDEDQLEDQEPQLSREAERLKGFLENASSDFELDDVYDFLCSLPATERIMIGVFSRLTLQSLLISFCHDDIALSRCFVRNSSS